MGCFGGDAWKGVCTGGCMNRLATKNLEQRAARRTVRERERESMAKSGLCSRVEQKCDAVARLSTNSSLSNRRSSISSCESTNPQESSRVRRRGRGKEKSTTKRMRAGEAARRGRPRTITIKSTHCCVPLLAVQSSPFLHPGEGRSHCGLLGIRDPSPR